MCDEYGIQSAAALPPSSETRCGQRPNTMMHSGGMLGPSGGQVEDGGEEACPVQIVTFIT